MQTSRLRALQSFDLAGQIVCCIAPSIYRFWSGSSSLGGNPFGVLFVLGAWQLASALLHLGVWRQLPGRKIGRRVHLCINAAMTGILVLGLVAEHDRSGFGFIGVLMLLLIASPVLAFLYFAVTAAELRALTAEIGYEEPVDTKRVTIIQSLLLFATVMPAQSASFSGVSAAAPYLGWIAAIAGYALALWLFVLLYTDRRDGIRARGETICAGLFVGLILMGIVLRRSGVVFSYNSFVFMQFLDPRLVLTAWFICRLHGQSNYTTSVSI